jgi:hypothetical protein
MSGKVCSKCGIEKDLSFFNKDKSSKDGLQSKCRECQKILRKKYYQNNKEIEINRAIEWAQNNPDKAKESNKRYMKNNKPLIAERKRQYYEENREILSVKSAQYYEENKEDFKKNSKKYYEDNKEAVKEYNKKNELIIRARHKIYRENNKENIAIYNKKYKKDRMESDVSFKLRKTISNSILSKINKDGKSIIKYLDYSIDQLKQHLENQFEPWMSWENHGKYDPKTWNDSDSTTWTWQIDHIIPHSLFKYISMEDRSFKDCWALNNLRPLSSKINHSDGVKRTRHRK